MIRSLPLAVLTLRTHAFRSTTIPLVYFRGAYANWTTTLNERDYFHDIYTRSKEVRSIKHQALGGARYRNRDEHCRLLEN